MTGQERRGTSTGTPSLLCRKEHSAPMAEGMALYRILIWLPRIRLSYVELSVLRRSDRCEEDDRMAIGAGPTEEGS